MPYISGENKTAPHDYIFWRGGSRWSVLSSDGMKHIKVNGDKMTELYDQSSDISESQDLMSKDTEKAKQLRTT